MKVSLRFILSVFWVIIVIQNVLLTLGIEESFRHVQGMEVVHGGIKVLLVVFWIVLFTLAFWIAFSEQLRDR